MEVNKKLIQQIASLARLNLTPAEIKEFLPQLKEILEYFSKLKKVNTNKIKPSFQPIELKNVYRKDIIKKGLTQKQALANTKHKKDGFFKGPKAI